MRCCRVQLIQSRIVSAKLTWKILALSLLAALVAVLAAALQPGVSHAQELIKTTWTWL